MWMSDRIDHDAPELPEGARVDDAKKNNQEL